MPSNKVPVRLRLKVIRKPIFAPLSRPAASSPSVPPGILIGGVVVGFILLLVIFGAISGSGLGNSQVSSKSDSGSSTQNQVPTQPQSTKPAAAIATEQPKPTPIPTAAVKTISYGQEVTGNISKKGQSDSWFFNATSGDIVTIQTFQVEGAAFNPAFELLDPSGARVDYRQFCLSGDYYNRYTNVVLKFSGNYRIRIEAGGGCVTSDVGGYRLSLVKKPPSATISLGQSVTGVITLPYDYVEWHIYLEKGTQIRVVTTNNGGGLFSGFVLLDPSGAEEASSFSCINNNTARDLTIKFTGTYKIRGKDTCNGVDLGEFSLTISHR